MILGVLKKKGGVVLLCVERLIKAFVVAPPPLLFPLICVVLLFSRNCREIEVHVESNNN